MDNQTFLNRVVDTAANAVTNEPSVQVHLLQLALGKAVGVLTPEQLQSLAEDPEMAEQFNLQASEAKG